MTADEKPPIEFYFDFISPFAYLASLRIDELAARHGRRVEWSSMLIGVSVLKVMKLPPIRDLPLKGPYQRRELARYVRRHKVPIARTFGAAAANPLPAGRLFHWARKHHPQAAVPLARQIFHAYWAEDRDIGGADLLAGIAGGLGLDREDVTAVAAGERDAHLLREAVEDSLARGVFGSPFFIIDGEPFFGVDKLELIEEWLASGGW